MNILDILFKQVIAPQAPAAPAPKPSKKAVVKETAVKATRNWKVRLAAVAMLAYAGLGLYTGEMNPSEAFAVLATVDFNALLSGE